MPAPKPPMSGKLTFGSINKKTGQRIVLYGTGGIGKTTLALSAPGPIAFFDLDDSLPTLHERMDTKPDVQVVQADSWRAIRDALQSDGWDEIKTIVLDSGTVLEELAIKHVCATVKTDNGRETSRIEDYGFGKGYQHVYDAWLGLLSDLDKHKAAGRTVILICHDCTSPVPNPAGDNWIRYEPRLQTSATGKASVRHRVREWADHLLFIGYDVEVTGGGQSKMGKARGGGTRTLYPAELPHIMAKSRTLAEPRMIEQNDTDFWRNLL